jgi:ElaA protein
MAITATPVASSASAAISWQHLAFQALSPQQLYAALQLRSEVFVMEQNCPFQDMDGADAQAWHVLGWAASSQDQPVPTLVAYARCFPVAVKFAEASIGRVVTRAMVRGTGAGAVVMQQAIACVQRQWGVQPIRIGAQAHLERFYGRLGFVTASLPYIEDGIPHIEMLRL